MNTSQESPPSGPAPADDAGGAALVAALETASTAIWCLAGPGLEPVWANARARDLGTATGDIAAVTSHRVAELAGEVARSGHAETVTGALHPAGRAATVVLQPLQVHGQPGVLVLVEADHTGCEHVATVAAEGDVVDQVQHSLLPPTLPLLPDVRLSGSYHRASSVHAAGGDWYDAVPLGRGRLALVVGDAVGHGVPAAGAMSRLRGAMRSVALRDPSPAAVMAALDAFAGQMDDVEGASVFYGVLEAATGRLTYRGHRTAAAGLHPRAVLRRRGGCLRRAVGRGPGPAGRGLAGRARRAGRPGGRRAG